MFTLLKVLGLIIGMIIMFIVGAIVGTIINLDFSTDEPDQWENMKHKWKNIKYIIKKKDE
jgi:hypothetical protein